MLTPGISVESTRAKFSVSSRIASSVMVTLTQEGELRICSESDTNERTRDSPT